MSRNIARAYKACPLHSSAVFSITYYANMSLFSTKGTLWHSDGVSSGVQGQRLCKYGPTLIMQSADVVDRTCILHIRKGQAALAFYSRSVWICLMETRTLYFCGFCLNVETFYGLTKL